MEWLLFCLKWYFPLLIISIIFLPLTQKIFKKFSFDNGYAFSKIIAILFLSYSIFTAGVFKVLPFNREVLFLLLFVFAVINYFIIKVDKNKIKKTYLIIIFEELLFLASLIFWTFVRGQEPSIHGLEKFMDFGFINSILRSEYFPPKDIWLAGHSLNYYYFGHLTAAVLIKLVKIKPAIGYNLILSSIFALSITQVFSLVANITATYAEKVKNKVKFVIFGLIGSFIVNLGGNLHTIYLFTSGYPNEEPIPFWKILSAYDSTKYWYPNATRFIPLTIHEFPIYSYIVADLHGHVFDIPFVLLTLAILFKLFTSFRNEKNKEENKTNFLKCIFNRLSDNKCLTTTIFLGFLTAVHYMTNAFDGPIYILLILVFFFIIFRLSYRLIINLFILFVSFLLFSLPFSMNFSPFVSGIGVNCAADFLIKIGKIGPFIFEGGNCQTSPFWMLIVLWGFFWINFILFLIVDFLRNRTKSKDLLLNQTQKNVNSFILVLFLFGTALLIIPEFFYIKDIYPAHFRANTMFKLGYQAFMIMGIASAYTFFKIKLLKKTKGFILAFVFIFFFSLTALYPFLAIPSYYGTLKKPVELDGSKWLNLSYSEDKQIIDYLNKNISGQPVVLEAQGDSYTDYQRISAYTGLPTIAGWWVHEWLWRGSSDIVGDIIPDIVNIYESDNIQLTKKLIKKYDVKYVVVSGLEKEKYPNLNKDKFNKIGKIIFKTDNNLGALYQVNFE